MSLTSPSGWALERIEYDSGQLQSIHSALESLMDDGGDARVILGNVESGLEGRGEAISTAKSEAGELASAMDPTLSMLQNIAHVVRAYGEAVDQHAKTANDLIDDVEAADRALESARNDLADARDAQQTAAAGTDDAAAGRAADGVADAESTLSVRQTALEDAWAQWEAAYRAWDAAYGDAVAGLARVDGSVLSSSALATIDALANADSPQEVAEIWAGLSGEEQAALRSSHPGFIGNLEGVPYRDRFLANEAAYESVMDAGPYGDPLDAQLAQLGREIRRNGGELLMFHPFESPQATAAVMYGVRLTDEHGNAIDPLADITNVNVLVGGMFSGLDDLEAWGDSARNLNTFADGYNPGVHSATIAWYGYDSPNLLSEPVMGGATEGAATLTSTLRGLDAAVATGVTTSVIGHSYGSTTAFLAVGSTSDNLGVDRLIAVGSAGVPDGYHAFWTGEDEMDYSGSQIYASRAPGDLVARFGEESSFGHGTNPEDIPGAVSFESDGGTYDGVELKGTPGHAAHDGGNTFWGWWEEDNGYLARDTESFHNVANIVANGEPLPQEDAG